MSDTFDVIIIGSGPSGVHAAMPLVAAGLRVTLLDGGIEPDSSPPENLPEDFLSVRRTRFDQAKIFLGEDFSNIPVEENPDGMIGGNRSYVTRDTESLLPLVTHGGRMTQSLALGGLASAWGAAGTYFSDTELSAMGLPPEEMKVCYEEITRIIGVSGPETFPGVQKALQPDHHAQALLKKSARKANALARQGITVRQPHTAILTQDLGSRKAYRYTDLEYYSDPRKSVYRPQYTLDDLQQHANFTYVPHILVHRIESTHGSVTVHSNEIVAGKKGIPRCHSAHHVILAAGAINTARILLQSLRLSEVQVPFMSKPHVLAACTHPMMLGQTGHDQRSSLCQLLINLASHPEYSGACSQLYSYRSFMLYRLIPNIPLPMPEALTLLSLCTPSMMIAGIRFESTESNALLTLKNGGIDVVITKHVKTNPKNQETLRRLYRAFRTLGLYPFHTRFMPEGTTFHYAGTVPTNPFYDSPLSVDQNGALRQIQNVSVADASVFRTFPAEPHALTLMANARRVGKSVANLFLR